MKHYIFECIDDEDMSKTTIEFSTESDAWSGFDGPMFKFLDFLRGCGYVFQHDAHIGILDRDGEFTGADE